ncbi:hypothetical protein FF38_05740 [Lucilia cuprina]|uniref:Uncharacterized protein n=1 Tax=Lucilia cuprina TaxID=7375 RepID=A0A0L0CAR2_LUCCU|nr:hypothetical protein FF38_05740 [Lucilia cuprina]
MEYCDSYKLSYNLLRQLLISEISHVKENALRESTYYQVLFAEMPGGPKVTHLVAKLPTYHMLCFRKTKHSIMLLKTWPIIRYNFLDCISNDDRDMSCQTLLEHSYTNALCFRKTKHSIMLLKSWPFIRYDFLDCTSNDDRDMSCQTLLEHSYTNAFAEMPGGPKVTHLVAKLPTYDMVKHLFQ